MRIRAAGPEDAVAIAALHTQSWQTAYRGMAADAYLDGALAGEHHEHWQALLGSPPEGAVILIAEADGTSGGPTPEQGEAVGFVAAYPGPPLPHVGATPGEGSASLVGTGMAGGEYTGAVDQPPFDPGPGAILIDNLHVRPDLKGKGIGRALLADAMLRAQGAGLTSAYLSVLDGNHRARHFYERLGGRYAAEEMIPFAGVDLAVHWLVFDDLRTLAAAATAGR